MSRPKSIHRIKVGWPDYITQELLRGLRYAFIDHRAGAKARGIRFELSFVRWLDIWIASGRLFERGRSRDQYVMARIRDRGPYALGNVKIITFSQNSSEKVYRHSEEALRKMRLAQSAIFATPKGKAKMRRMTKLAKQRSKDMAWLKSLAAPQDWSAWN